MRELLEKLNLSDYVSAAFAWCAEQGLDSVSEIKEAEMEQDFVDALELKPGKAKILRKRFADQALGDVKRFCSLGYNLRVEKLWYSVAKKRQFSNQPDSN